MKLDEILELAGKHPRRKRVGRGTGSGHGKTSGRGTKGMYARSGAKRRFGYEGGQNPMLARAPKRGFSNAGFRTEYQIVNVSELQKFDDGARVDPQALLQAGMIDNPQAPVKVLGNGDLSKKLTVVAHKFSASAKDKIAGCGGSVEEVQA